MELEGLCCMQFILCPPFICSRKKAAESQEGDSVSSIPLKMHAHTVTEDLTLRSPFPHKPGESAALRRTVGASVGGGCPAAAGMEERLDKMYLEILRKKTAANPSLLPQDDKTNQVRSICLSSWG